MIDLHLIWILLARVPVVLHGRKAEGCAITDFISGTANKQALFWLFLLDATICVRVSKVVVGSMFADIVSV